MRQCVCLSSCPNEYASVNGYASVNAYASPHCTQVECAWYRLTVGACISTRLPYSGTGQAQRWPRFSNQIAPVSLGMMPLVSRLCALDYDIAY